MRFQPAHRSSPDRNETAGAAPAIDPGRERTALLVRIGVAAIALTVFALGRPADVVRAADADAVVDHPAPVVMVADDEPGVPLLVTGTVFAPDGSTPVAGAELEVYHTDSQGHYGDDGEGNARIRAILRTDANGRYAYRTIRPAHYAGGGPPAHVHYVIRADGYPEQRAALHFADDPQLGERGRARAGEPFYSVRPVERGEDGVWRCVRDIRLER